MKVVSIPGAGCVACLRNGDALVLRDSRAARSSELADNPSVGELIVNYYRITIATVLAGATKARPN